MSNRVECFLIDRTNRVRVFLRRYCSGSTCPVPGNYYHNAEVAIRDEDAVLDAEGCYRGDAPMVDHADPHWPAVCECGYAFQEEDEWQVARKRLYRRAGTGEEMPLHDWPAGAMWWADWCPAAFDSPLHQGRGGGPHLYVRTPGGDWDIDAKSRNGSGWSRVGEAPKITARPSILIPGRDGEELYHGWLTHGVLERC